MSRTGIAAVLLVMVCLGCATSNPPVPRSSGPVPEYYVVEKGDTLYEIAWRYRLDHRLLALANGIRPPYTIYPEQKLRLTEHVIAVHDARRVRTIPSDIAWRWPTTAAISEEFSRRNPAIDFRLARGDAVRACAAGEVVYSGAGLDGYPFLVILKHDDAYLSAYSSRQNPRVREGARVKAGALLADTVSRAEAGGTLRFEIRTDGKAVDPRSLLGPR
ncbi:MAG: peptidoglycan DD-metalloendopeptidase family protein [Pseudomonadales bacterium]